MCENYPIFLHKLQVIELCFILVPLSVNKVNLTGLVSEISPGNSYLSANIDVFPEYLSLPDLHNNSKHEHSTDLSC